MTDTHPLLTLADTQARQAGLPYFGALTPDAALQLLQALPDAVLVDVRTRAELDWVGRPAIGRPTIDIEWNRYPGGQPNPDFASELQASVPTDRVVLFLCRSGGRSNSAAALAAGLGYGRAINILEGFEGDRDGAGQRNRVGGWRARQLPWVQS